MVKQIMNNLPTREELNRKKSLIEKIKIFTKYHFSEGFVTFLKGYVVGLSVSLVIVAIVATIVL